MTCEPPKVKAQKTIKKKPCKLSPQEIMLKQIIAKREACEKEKQEKLAIKYLYEIMAVIDRLNFEKDMLNEEHSRKLNKIFNKRETLKELEERFDISDYQDKYEADEIKDDINEIEYQIKKSLARY